MKIDHLAIWVTDLESMKDFYVRYFDMNCGVKYHNPQKHFTSYFLSFKDGQSRIELMNRPDISAGTNQKGSGHGLTHFAISVGSKELVNSMTERFRKEGYTIYSE